MSDSNGLGEHRPDQPEFAGPDFTYGPPTGNRPPPQPGQSAPYPAAAPSGPHRADTPGQQYPGQTQPRVAGPPYSPTQHHPVGPPPYSPATAAQPGWSPDANPWGPPAGQPVAPAPRRPRRGGWIALVALALAIVLGTVGWLAWPTLTGRPGTTPTPNGTTSPGSTGPTVVRTSEATRPTTTVSVGGGSIGRPITYRINDAEARVTVTAANWVDNGLIEPDEGSAYLVVDLSFEGLSGVAITGPFFTQVTESNGTSHTLTLGARLNPLLTVKALAAGDTNVGQVAFELPRQAVTFEVLDEDLSPVARVEIPG